MTLHDLAPDLDMPPAVAAIEIGALALDSRRVRPGALFAALPGSRADGARFVPDAVANGAAAVLVGAGVSLDPALPVPAIRDADPRRRLALMAARFFAHQPETVVAVTGTAGKTSVAEFARQIFAAAGHQAASLGTLGVRGARERTGELTTPDPIALHETLAGLAAEGTTHLALEASSHGIDQRRLDGVRLKAAAFTNIGRDHLDYHPTPEAYLAAKLRLFEVLLPDGAAVVADPGAPGAQAVIAVASRRGLALHTVGAAGTAIRLVEAVPRATGHDLALEGRAGRYAVHLPLVGRFQVENALVAAGLAIAAGVPEGAAIAALEGLCGAPGRLEAVGRTAAGAPVFVDYAHKPEAIRAVLAAVRPSVPGRLVIVFGAGGDRDPGKRPLMGEAATEGADIVIVTDDNPRSEDPAAIRAAIIEAAPEALEIGHRAAAIRHAIALLREGDALIVAGKGHETGQIVGGRVLPFSDHAVVAEALAAEAAA